MWDRRLGTVLVRAGDGGDEGKGKKRGVLRGKKDLKGRGLHHGAGHGNSPQTREKKKDDHAAKPSTNADRRQNA